MTNQITKGYPSIDKPWLKYYSQEAREAPLPSCSMYEFLHQNNKGFLDNIALNYYGRKITYGTLLENIERTAKAFASCGVMEGDIAIICSVNTPETVCALYALNRLGAVANMVDPRTSVEGMRNYIEECDARIVVTVDLAYPLIVKAAKGTMVNKIITISPADSLSAVMGFLYRLKNKSLVLGENSVTWEDFIASGQNTELPVCKYEKGRCAVIAHTGGTTGIPKGVMLSDDNINAVAHSYHYINIPFERGSRYFNDLPPFIVYGLSIATHTTLCLGMEVVLYPKFDSQDFPNQLAKYRPNHFSALSDHLKYLSESKKTKKMDLSFLIAVGVGGDSLDTKLERQVNAFLKEHNCQYEVQKGYGMTEVGATATTSFDGANAIGSVGAPLIANTVKIVDTETGEELPYNDIGEILISGPSVMMGYYKMRSETEKIIFTDNAGVRWLHTGDLGYMDENGLLFHQGRIRRIYMTAIDGQPAKIFPMVVEAAIKCSERVSATSVVGRKIQGSAYYEAVAFVVTASADVDRSALIDELDALCKEQAPSYMWPVEYRFVEQIPHTPTGKVDFVKLEEMASLSN